MSSDPLCKCGHPRSAHEHYRAGTECSLCACKKFREGMSQGRWVR